MDAVRATAAAAATTAATSTTDASSSTSTDAATTKKSFTELFAAAKEELAKGEKLQKVAGHQFGRIKGGERDDMCVNLSGNARSGQAFDLIWRDGRQFHVYGGSGADRVVVEVGHKTTTSGSATDTTSTDTTTSSSAGDTSPTSSKSTTTSSSGTTSAASTGGVTAA